VAATGCVVVFFAVVVASALYAGQPGTVALLVVAVAVFVVVLVVTRAHGSSQKGQVLSPLVDLAVASVTGTALAAPLLLPGTQLLSQSILRNVQRLNHALPSQDVLNLILQGFNGLPLARTQFFGVGAAAYVGVIGVVLAVMGLVRRRRQPQVLAFGVVALAMAALAFLPPVVALANTFPYCATWSLAVVLLSFCIAVLAGVGMDVPVRSRGERAVRSGCAGGLAAAAIVLLELWFFGRGHLPRAHARLRAESFVWPAIQIVVGLAVIGFLVAGEKRAARHQETGAHGRMQRDMWAGAALLICETGFLVGVGAPLFSSSSTFFAPTVAITGFQRAVGSWVVGFGTRSCQVLATIGILQEANIGYEVHEFAAFGPAFAPSALSVLAGDDRSGAQCGLVGIGFLPRRHHGGDRPRVWRGLRSRTTRCPGTAWRGLRHGDRQRGAFSDTEIFPGHRRRHPDHRDDAGGRRGRSGGAGVPSRPRVIEGRRAPPRSECASPPTHCRAGLACHYRRPAAAAPAGSQE